jgi:hypothetical protein
MLAAIVGQAPPLGPIHRMRACAKKAAADGTVPKSTGIAAAAAAHIHQLRCQAASMCSQGGCGSAGRAALALHVDVGSADPQPAGLAG